MSSLDSNALIIELKNKNICRFCLSQNNSKLTNIYARNTQIKFSVPLPNQIMGVASIKVFSEDDMPSYICTDCTNMFAFSYQFQQMCKKADLLLRQFPSSGKLPAILDKPVLLTNQFSEEMLATPTKYSSTAQYSKSSSGAALTSDISSQSDRNVDFTITFLDQIESNGNSSLDNIHQLVASADVSKGDNVPVMIDQDHQNNKLNIKRDPGNEDSLSSPKHNKDADIKEEIINNLQHHSFIDNRVKTYKCSSCDQAFSDVPKYICVHCEQTFLVKDEFRHNKQKEPNTTAIETNIFPCTHCERSFSLLQLRDIHMKDHSRDRKFQCVICQKMFLTKGNLQRHSVKHSNEKPHKCSVCNKFFSRSNVLKRHQKMHTDLPKHICSLCGQSFFSKEDMEKHLENHKINRPFVCKICNKRFVVKQSLDRHMVIHSRQEAYKCQYCKEGFPTTTKLYRHLTTHAGVKPYPCKYCKKSYLLPHHLTRHMRSHKNVDDHTNTVSFVCIRCNCTFKTRDELISHSTTHSNKINLECSLCKDVFNDISELNSHIQDHSQGEAYACEFCDLIFLTAEKLQSHTDCDHIKEMKAYHTDDNARANKLMEDNKSQINILDIAEEQLQENVNEFLVDKLPYEGNNMKISLKREIKVETELTSSEIITQSRNDAEFKGNRGLLNPLKQRKLELPVKRTKAQSKMTQQATTSSCENVTSLKKPPKKNAPTKKIKFSVLLPAPKIIKEENEK